MYNDTVLDHFQNPRNTGELENANGIGQVGNPSCGDVMKMFVLIENGILVELRHKTFGCTAAIACSSITSELVVGKNIEEALKLTRKEVATALNGLPERKMDCSNLAPDALRAAIENYRVRIEECK